MRPTQWATPIRYGRLFCIFVMTLLKKSVVAAIFAASSVALAHGPTPEVINCPAQIEQNETVKTTPQGWYQWNTNPSGQRQFFDITFSDGPPENAVYLNPVQVKTTAQGEINIYDFRSTSFSKIWLSCLYRDSTLAMTRELALQDNVCTVTYQGKQPIKKVTSIECRKIRSE